MSDKESIVEKTRRKLNAPGFDPTSFLTSQAVNEVSPDATDLEGRLFFFFDKFASDVSKMSLAIEDEIKSLQQSAGSMESFLLDELDDQLEKLVNVENAVEEVKEDFQLASDGAIRVGGKLATTEKERINIKRSIDLMKLVKEFQWSPDDLYADVQKMNAQKLREILPESLRNQEWSLISKTLYDLKKVLLDINSEDVQKSQQVILNISEVVELELLGQFDVLLDELMEYQEDVEVVNRARTLAECLHLFNNGQSLHKRYIFSVVEKRIPSDAFLESNRGRGENMLSKVKKAIQKQGRRLKLPPAFHGPDYTDSPHYEDEEASVSSGGASANDDLSGDEGPEGMLEGAEQYNAGDSSLQLIDHLSRLFTMINRVCIEQFSIIRKVFPLHTIPRVTRQLIQRIFNDPAFGIQARVDAILNPQPPAPSLSLSDYLDALLTVREKLSALNVLLLECAADATMIGMGSEVISMRKAKKEAVGYGPSGSGGSRNAKTKGASDHRAASPVPDSSALSPDALAELYLEDHQLENEEKLKSDAEIREFFYDQSAQVLVGYVTDYFEKEVAHVRHQYVTALRKAVDDHSNTGKVFAGTVLQLPHFRAEKMKSIQQIVNTVANKKFLNEIFTITTDAVTRMESIGRDDKKLPQHVKDLYLLQLGFITEGLILPWSKTSVTMLLKVAGSKPQNSALPPFEVFPSLVALTYGKHRINTHYNDIFMRPLSTSPNLMAACKETKQKYFGMIRKTANEVLFAWTLGVGAHLDKSLVTLQGKYDYNPVFEGLSATAAAAVGVASNGSMGRNRFSMMGVNAGPLEASAACDAVCKAFIQVTNVVRSYEADIIDLDMTALFWRPFGQQFIGIIISHLRRQTISVDGARQLRKDLEEYRHVTALMNSAETSDMIACLEEICVVYEATSGEEVMRIVTEDLRHLDTSVVLGLVKLRSDFQNPITGTTNAWAKALSTKYLNYKWDTMLPWEGRKPVTVLAFREAMSGGNAGQKLGPKTLRRAGHAVANIYMAETLRQQQQQQRLMLGASTGGALSQQQPTKQAPDVDRGSRVISLDLRALATGRETIIDKHIRDAELSAREQWQQQNWQQQEDTSRANRFLPSRPDEESQPAFNRSSSVDASANKHQSTRGMLQKVDNSNGTARRSVTNGAGGSNGSNGGGNAAHNNSAGSVKGMFQKMSSFFGNKS